MNALVSWGHTALTLVIDAAPGGPVGIRTLSSAANGAGAPHPTPPATVCPLVEVLVAGEGRARASRRFLATAVGLRLVLAGSRQTRAGGWHELAVDLHDPHTGLAVQVRFRSPDGVDHRLGLRGRRAHRRQPRSRTRCPPDPVDLTDPTYLFQADPQEALASANAQINSLFR